MGAFDRVVQWAKAYNEKEMERIRSRTPKKPKQEPPKRKSEDPEYDAAYDSICAEFDKLSSPAHSIIKTFPIHGPGKFRTEEALWDDAEKTINRFYKKLLVSPQVVAIFEAVAKINNDYLENHPDKVGPCCYSFKALSVKDLQNSFSVRSEYPEYIVVVEAVDAIDNQSLSVMSGMPYIIADLLEHCYPSDFPSVGTGDGDEGCVYP